MKRIMCYGDSNTWGNIPGVGTRYPEDIRWTGVVSGLLGPEYTIIEEGLNGRTTSFDDYYVEYRNGRKGLGYALCAHAPIDLIVISLGTNDLKYTGAVGSYKGLDELLRLLENTAPGRNGGGWIDLGGSSDNLNIYLEQADLTMFAKAKVCTL